MVMQLTFNHSNIGLNPIGPKLKIKNFKVDLIPPTRFLRLVRRYDELKFTL